MIKEARLGKEVVVVVANKIGVLADMSRILADHGINVEAVAGYAQDNEAKIMVVTGDNLRAVDALKKNKYTSAVEKEVVIVDLENKPGALKILTNKLALGNIDIRYIYGTASNVSAPAKIVLSTTDNAKALLLCKEK